MTRALHFLPLHCRRSVALAVINTTTVLLSLCIASRMAVRFFRAEDAINIGTLALILLFVCIPVHAIKMFRLYLAQYGSDVKFREHAAVYCAAALALITWPVKCGEIYKMYAYGREVASPLRGIVITLLDRFMDTAGLLTVIVLLQILDSAEPAATELPFFGALLIFISFLVLCYLLFPRLYRFWNTQLLRRIASKRNMAALGIIEHIKALHKEAAHVLRGRGTIMYFLSIASYMAEAASMMVFTGHSISPLYMTEYITSSLRGTPSVEMSRFVISSVFLLTMLFIAASIASWKKHENGGKR